MYYSDRFPIILVTIQFISDIIATGLTGSIRARRWDRHILRPAAGGRNVPGGSPVSGIRRNRKRWISRQAEKEVRSCWRRIRYRYYSWRGHSPEPASAGESDSDVRQIFSSPGIDCCYLKNCSAIWRPAIFRHSRARTGSGYCFRSGLRSHRGSEAVKGYRGL